MRSEKAANQTLDAQLTKSANNCWDLFNALPQDFKTRVITLGLIWLIKSKFEGDEAKRFWDVISGI